MKKIIIFVLFALILVLVIYTLYNKLNNNIIIYKNESLGFSLEIPESWEGKYETIERDNSVTFYQSGTLKKFGDSTGRLFTIVRSEGTLSKEEAENTLWPSHFLMHASGYTYVMSMPSDVQAPIWSGGDLKLADEYERMANDIEQIKQSIKSLY